MGFVYKVLFLPFAFLIKAEVGSLLFVLLGKNLIITFQHIVIQVVRKNTRLCTSGSVLRPWPAFKQIMGNFRERMFL